MTETTGVAGGAVTAAVVGIAGAGGFATGAAAALAVLDTGFAGAAAICVGAVACVLVLALAGAVLFAITCCVGRRCQSSAMEMPANSATRIHNNPGGNARRAV